MRQESCNKNLGIERENKCFHMTEEIANVGRDSHKNSYFYAFLPSFTESPPETSENCDCCECRGKKVGNILQDGQTLPFPNGS